MAKMYCRICLNSEVKPFQVLSDVYRTFFTEVVGDKNIPNEIYLCIWCKSFFKKMGVFVCKAVESFQIIANDKMDTEYKRSDKTLFQLSYCHNETIHIIDDSYVDIKKESVNSNIEYVNVPDVVEFEENEFEYETELEGNMNYELKLECEDGIEFKNRKEMKFKVRYLNVEEQLAEIEGKRSSEKYKKMNFQCQSCGVGFLSDDVYEEHKKRHLKTSGPHKCAICKLRFKTKDVLSHHTMSHRRKFACLLCPAVYSRWCHCMAHRQSCGVSSENVVCAICNKIYRNKYSLDIHMKGVHKKRNYICNECNKSFTNKQHLTIHIRSHTGVRPYACKICPRKFAHNSNLLAHAATHIPGKQHYCVECNTWYKTNKGLTRHLTETALHVKRDGNRATCSMCPKQFGSQKQLECHMNLHLNPPTCQFCDKEFSTNSNLRKHMTRVHSS